MGNRGHLSVIVNNMFILPSETDQLIWYQRLAIVVLCVISLLLTNKVLLGISITVFYVAKELGGGGGGVRPSLVIFFSLFW